MQITKTGYVTRFIQTNFFCLCMFDNNMFETGETIHWKSPCPIQLRIKGVSKEHSTFYWFECWNIVSKTDNLYLIQYYEENREAGEKDAVI